MPIYEYQCTQCGHRLETIQRFSDAPLTDCPQCAQSALRKLLSAPAFRLKGGGWYETDFKSGSKRNLAGDGAGEGAGGNGAGGAAAGEKGAGEKGAAEKNTADKGAGGKSGADKSGGDSGGASKDSGGASNKAGGAGTANGGSAAGAGAAKPATNSGGSE